jgi:phytoene dehydrogenase-like protein
MRYDCVIVGGGIAGLTSAAFLARAGKRVAVLEKQPVVGGLVQTFSRDGVFFDTGLRSIEDSGIVFPMLRQLGIEIDFVKSPVSIGIGTHVLNLKDEGSLDDYEAFLKSHYPGYQDDVGRIIAEVRKIMGYMDVLYGLDNPAFLDLMEDKRHLMTVILPWLFRFLFTIRKIKRLKEPVDEYLQRLTRHQPLIDMIAQHFFQKTPTSFALSYFRLYLDYYYPRGGTAVLPRKLESFILDQGGEIKTGTTVVRLDPETRELTDTGGNRIGYEHLVWAADMKHLYQCIDTDRIVNRKLAGKIEQRRAMLKDLQGGDSVYTVYLSVNEKREYFSDICTGHFFYTPRMEGLSALNREGLDSFLDGVGSPTDDLGLKEGIKRYLKDYCDLNTFEISIPALRDESLAPEGRTGLIVSLLFDYRLALKIDEYGWTGEMKDFIEEQFIRVLDESIFPGIRNKIIDRFSSTPLTIARLTGNTDGGITGWAFTNPVMPAESRLLQVARSVDTLLPSVYQAGQWVYSPSGLPISILTGKLASDKVLKS